MAIDEIIEEIRGLQTDHPRMLVTLDGPCASGKTTLARRLAELLNAGLIHTDDYVVPHSMKTPERLVIPGGNCHWERLTEEVLALWEQGEPVTIRRYLWHEQRLSDPEPLPDCSVLILEGSYCNLPSIRKYASLCLFMDTPEEIRRSRLIKRETPESVQRYDALWIPLENAYFEAYHLPDQKCLIVRNDEFSVLRTAVCDFLMESPIDKRADI